MKYRNLPRSTCFCHSLAIQKPYQSRTKAVHTPYISRITPVRTLDRRRPAVNSRIVLQMSEQTVEKLGFYDAFRGLFFCIFANLDF